MITVNGLEAKRYRVTEAGLRELRQQLYDIKKQRMEVADELREISSQSNTASALEDSTFATDQNTAIELDGQIELLERIIGLAEIITPPKTNTEVQVGSRVYVDIQGAEHSYVIVGSVEADPSEGKISHESPLGRCLLGKKAGDTVAIPARQPADATIRRIT
jgi:transcription elongation factor GreA